MKIQALPTSRALRVILIVTLSLLVAIPASSKFGTFRYQFSWSMYNGGWIPEIYTLTYSEPYRTTALERSALINMYKIKVLPYGIDALESVCKKDRSLIEIKRLGTFTNTHRCSSNE
jgi:hypothetical protein